ncbi:signal peptidase II [Candidatus Curtissbacteria bacterium]|nr:signal peptidase II [Candidatus Curtissbacteria bacterium]
MNLKKRKDSSLVLIFFLVLADQSTKFLALTFLPTVCNHAYALGWLEQIFSIYVPIGALLLLFYFLGRAQTKLARLSYALIVAGGFANLIDRVLRGCVVDYVTLFTFPSFNFADVLISGGATCLVISFFVKTPNKDES